MSRTELKKSLSRRISTVNRGTFVVTIEPGGVRIRKFRKRGGVILPWREVAYRGLERAGLSLTEAQ